MFHPGNEFHHYLISCPENWSTRKGGQRKSGQRGKVVNAEKWSTRKGGHLGQKFHAGGSLIALL
jgi:hypothetical protein